MRSAQNVRVRNMNGCMNHDCRCVEDSPWARFLLNIANMTELFALVFANFMRQEIDTLDEQEILWLDEREVVSLSVTMLVHHSNRVCVQSR